MSQIENILLQFRNCFSRKKPFFYFCLVIISFMLVTDNSGVTSFIRILLLHPKTYDCLLKFFNAQSYSLDTISEKWLNVIERSQQCVLVEGRGILIGDHTKVAKEGRRMPAVKAQHQESEDLGKPQTIFGHHFGMLGILTGNIIQKFCTPLKLRIHEGTEQIAYWKGQLPLGRCERLVKEAIELCKKSIRDNYLVLDRDFMVEKAIRAVLDYNKLSLRKLDLIGRCKNNIVCQRELTEEEKEALKAQKRKGHPRKYTDKVYPMDWFKEFKDSFQTVQLPDGSFIELFSRNEFWHNMPLQFVLVIDQGKQLMFFTTDLKLKAQKVVELYRMRFSIEITFYGLKHIIHGFSYHFWVKGFEKLTKFNRDRHENVHDSLKPKIINCIERIERSVTFAGIALGILQFLALQAGSKFSPREIRYQRTYRHEDRLSVEQTQQVFGNIFAILLANDPDSLIAKIIRRFSNV